MEYLLIPITHIRGLFIYSQIGFSYRYRVRCDDYWSNFFTFTTPPSHGDMSPVKIFILGDHGTRMEGMTTIKAMLEAHRQNSYDLVVHVGDLSYANGGFTEYIWDIWAEMVEPIAAQLPYMVTPGNHEILLSDSGGELGIPYMKRFTMPMEMQGSFSEYWYSWNYGQIHFVSVSSEHAHNISQQQWVADDLRSASLHRDKTPWFVMFGHHSIYTSNQRHGNQTELRKWLDPLLLTYDVDIAFWGHDHAYERSYPITNSAVVQTDYEDPKAPIHVTCGASGWDLHDCWQPDVAFSAFHTAHTWGYCTLHVKSPTVASVKFIDQNKVVIDSVHIKKNRIGRSLISDGIKEVNIPVSLVNYTTDRTEYVTSDATSSNTTMATTTDANVTTSRGVDQTRLIPTESNQPTNILSNNTQEVAYAATSLRHTINSTAIPFQVSTKPTTTQLVPDKTTVRSDSVPSKSLKLSVVVAISSVAGLLLISVVYYLARRRRKKGNKYELLPLQNLSPSGSSDSEN